jgi:hypothetical protein
MQTQLLLLGQCKELARLQQLVKKVYIYCLSAAAAHEEDFFFFHVDEIIMLLEYI